MRHFVIAAVLFCSCLATGQDIFNHSVRPPKDPAQIEAEYQQIQNMKLQNQNLQLWNQYQQQKLAQGQSQPQPLPEQTVNATDGNGLLDYCWRLVEFVDVPATRTPENFPKVVWCNGYMHGTYHSYQAMQLAMGVQYSDSAQRGPFGVCIPPEASSGIQLSRITVKWLREHPAELHNDVGVLTFLIMKDAFPCAEPQTAKESH